MENNTFAVRELSLEEVMQVSGGDIADSSATGAALGTAAGVAYGSSAGYSAGQLVAAGAGGGVIGAAIGASFGAGYAFGTLLSNGYGAASSYFGGSGSLGGDIYDFFAS